MLLRRTGDVGDGQGGGDEHREAAGRAAGPGSVRHAGGRVGPDAQQERRGPDRVGLGRGRRAAGQASRARQPQAGLHHQVLGYVGTVLGLDAAG